MILQIIIVKILMSILSSTVFLPLTLIISCQAILMGVLKISRKLHFLFFILNIRSLNENFKSFVESLSFKFSIICFLETWSNDQNLSKNSLFSVKRRQPVTWKQKVS